MIRGCTTGLDFVRNVRLGEDERPARNKDDALIGAAARAGRQVFYGRFRNVYSDDREIAGAEFKNVGATPERNGEHTARVRIGSQSAAKFN